MKKLISILTIISLLLSLGVVASFADGESTGEAIAASYEGEVSPGMWLNQFDADGVCIGVASVIFNAGAPFTAIQLPVFYAGKDVNNQAADVRFELFAFTGEKESSFAADPVFTKEAFVDGDINGFTVDFEKTFSAGQYIFRVSQLTENPDGESPGPYSVLPIAEHAYATDVIDFDSKISTAGFVFNVVYDGSVPANEFFKPIQWSTPVSFKDDKAVQVVSRAGDNAHEIRPMSDYAILTAEIPEGKVLRYFTFKNAPTWSNTNHDSDLDYEVYIWDTDYDTTYGGQPIKSGSVFDHSDNQDLTLDFGARLKGGNRYLIVVYASNDGKIGFWSGNTIRREGWEFFEDGDETEIYPACEYKTSTYSGPEETPEPTPEPTPTPTEAPVATPTTVPEEPTDAPEEPTKAPDTAPTAEKEPDQKTSDSGKKSGCSGFVAGSLVSGLVLAAVVLVAKKKD